MNFLSIISKLFIKDNVLITMVLSVIILILSYFFQFDLKYIGLYLSSTLLFSTFDAYGHRYLLLQENTTIKQEYNSIYRVLQILFQIILYTLILSQSIVVFILVILTWMFGTCDFLYYILLKINYKFDNMINWMYWTVPMGIICKLIKKPFKYQYMIYQSIFVCVFSIGILLFYLYGSLKIF